MNKIKTILLICVCLASVSCLKEKREATYNNQESKIDQYISKNKYFTTTVAGKQEIDSLRVVYNGGTSRLVTQEGTGEMLKPNGTVSFYYAGYIFTGSKNLFATNHQQTATGSRWELTDAQYDICTLNLKNSDIIEGLRHGLVGVKTGEICQILFSGKYAYGKKPLGIVPANSALLFEIWVEGVSNE